MSIRKTLGGERLGSGNKMKVELHNYERSTFDMGYLWRSTMAPGTLVPFMCEVALPGDTFDINLDCRGLTHPTIGPLFGTYTFQIDGFLTPMRLYNAVLHMNQVNLGLKMNTVDFPLIEVAGKRQWGPLEWQDVDNIHVNPSSLLKYLGISGIGNGTNDDLYEIFRRFNATAVFVYWHHWSRFYVGWCWPIWGRGQRRGYRL